MPLGTPEDNERARLAEERWASLRFVGSRQRDVNATAETIAEFETILDRDPEWRAGVEEGLAALEESRGRFDEYYLAQRGPESEQNSKPAEHSTQLGADIAKVIAMPRKALSAAKKVLGWSVKGYVEAYNPNNLRSDPPTEEPG